MIVVYTKNNCPACERAKSMLRIKGISFVTKNVDEDLDAMDFVVENKHRAMPVVYRDGLHVTDINTIKP